MSQALDSQWQAESFQEHRPRLRSVAYRVLGSVADAEDAVQDCWLRFERTDPTTIDNVGGWLTTAVGRVALNMLRSRSRFVDAEVEGAVPDPLVVVDGVGDPEQAAMTADAVGLALMVVLDALAPAERVAFVLHDMFDVPFDEIAVLLERSEPATRKLASRARKRVQANKVVPTQDAARQRAVVDAFFTAATQGRLDALVATLHPDVVLRSDRGADQRVLVRGAEVVAGRAAMFADPSVELRAVLVNGVAGVLMVRDGMPLTLMAFTVVDDVVVEIDAIGDPERLRGIQID